MENNTIANNSIQHILNAEGVLTDWTRYTLICFMTLIALTGIPGNAVVIAVLSKLREKNCSDMYILAMASVDLVSSSIRTTCHILRYEPTAWRVIASSTFCRLHIFTIYLTSISTASLMAAVAFERQKRTSTGNALTNSRPEITKAKRVFALVMSSSFIFSTFFLLTTTLDSATQNCSLMEGYDTTVLILRSVLVLLFVLLFVAIIVCYIRIAMMLRGHHGKVQAMGMNTSPKRSILKRQSSWHNFDIPPLRENTQRRRKLTEIPTIAGQILTCATHKSMLQRFGRKSKVSFEHVQIEVENKETKLREEDHTVCSKTENYHPRRLGKEIRERETMPLGKVNGIKMLQRKQTTIGRKRNRTTLIMFLISSVYISTWIINWSTPAYWSPTDSPSRGLVFLVERFYLINGMIKPILYMLLCPEFMQRARNIFSKM